jgi:hypothetical protein
VIRFLNHESNESLFFLSNPVSGVPLWQLKTHSIDPLLAHIPSTEALCSLSHPWCLDFGITEVHLTPEFGKSVTIPYSCDAACVLFHTTRIVWALGPSIKWTPSLQLARIGGSSKENLQERFGRCTCMHTGICTHTHTYIYTNVIYRYRLKPHIYIVFIHIDTYIHIYMAECEFNPLYHIIE